MESEKYICVRETGAQNTVVIVDMATPQAPARRQISADSALMCLDKKVIALKATTAGTVGDALQVFNLDTKTKLKAYQMPETVEFWKWVTPTRLGLVTAGAVYHWDLEVGAPWLQCQLQLPRVLGAATCHELPVATLHLTLHVIDRLEGVLLAPGMYVDSGRRGGCTSQGV